MLVIEIMAIEYDRDYEHDYESQDMAGINRNPARNLARDTPLAQTSAHRAQKSRFENLRVFRDWARKTWPAGGGQLESRL